MPWCVMRAAASACGVGAGDRVRLQIHGIDASLPTRPAALQPTGLRNRGPCRGERPPVRVKREQLTLGTLMSSRADVDGFAPLALGEVRAGSAPGATGCEAAGS